MTASRFGIEEILKSCDVESLQNSEVFQSGKVHLGDPSDVIPVQVSVKKKEREKR